MPKKRLHQDLYSCLGEVIYIRRKRLGLSQEELAHLSSVDRAFISDIERGKRRPSFGVVASIAEGLSLKLSQLISRCEKRVSG
jgi:transcriptional regulator with XRE-family HTH domain